MASKKVTTAKEVADAVPSGAPVRVRLQDGVVLHEDFTGTTEIRGWWRGVVPNPKINDLIRDAENGWHWMAEIADIENVDMIYDIHLETIKAIDVLPEQELRPS